MKKQSLWTYVSVVLIAAVTVWSHSSVSAQSWGKGKKCEENPNHRTNLPNSCVHPSCEGSCQYVIHYRGTCVTGEGSCRQFSQPVVGKLYNGTCFPQGLSCGCSDGYVVSNYWIDTQVCDSHP